jgi:23S rRNA G2069 N7-methylase RlmK/C1962 C5-methylase RlmI
MDQTVREFGRLLKKYYLEVRRYSSEVESTCMRVYDRQLTQLPLTVDIYSSSLLISDYREDSLPAEPKADELIRTAASMLYRRPEDTVYTRREKGGSNTLPTEPCGRPHTCEVTEHGLKFIVKLGCGLDTGLFLDHSLTRALVRAESPRRRVLNLFSYTGSFSVYAAAGWASEVVSVDLSAGYLQWAKENMELNGYSGPAYRFAELDCGTYLEEAARARERFDLVILDPPSFSNSRKVEGTFNVQRDYRRYIEMIRRILSPEGAILFSTNLNSFRFSREAVRSFAVKDITRETIPPGYSTSRLPHRCWVLTQQARRR